MLWTFWTKTSAELLFILWDDACFDDRCSGGWDAVCGISACLSRGHFVVLKFYLMCPFWIKLDVWNSVVRLGWDFFPHPPTLVCRLFIRWPHPRPKHVLGLSLAMWVLLMRVPTRFWRMLTFYLVSSPYYLRVCHGYIPSRVPSNWCWVAFWWTLRVAVPERPSSSSSSVSQIFYKVSSFYRDDGPVYRPLTLVAGDSATGAWRKVFCANEYPRLVFKLMPSTEDMSYTTEEIRAFRQIPDYTAQFVQEFHTWLRGFL